MSCELVKISILNEREDHFQMVNGRKKRSIYFQSFRLVDV